LGAARASRVGAPLRAVARVSHAGAPGWKVARVSLVEVAAYPVEQANSAERAARVRRDLVAEVTRLLRQGTDGARVRESGLRPEDW
ncbi:MAG: hypothetical protein JWO42_1530, partial [Chloroflexi bacterium]|nr:hypothetical protein [Chloroflexota bacterium]